MPPRMLAVVDLDGVVADVRHRLHHLSGGRKDWPAFFAAAADDGLLAEGSETVHRLAEVYDVATCPAAPSGCAPSRSGGSTSSSLPDGQLLLRPDGDYRPSRVYKVEALRRLAETRTVVVLVDDDQRVLDAAREAGFDVLPARWMGEHSVLREAQERDGRT